MEHSELSGNPSLTYLLESRSNWGRWGQDDERGTINLITPERRIEAARLVKTGKTVSLARPISTQPSTNNPRPALHFMENRGASDGWGIAADFIGLSSHGLVTTHIDALCHLWNDRGMWNGRNPEDHLRIDGATWAGVDQWREGIVTRGVLVDVPRFRGVDCITVGNPVTGSELGAILDSHGLEVHPGDALVVYCGRDAWEQGAGPYGGTAAQPSGVSSANPRPGLDASCLEPIRDWDCSMLVWDMLDSSPNEHAQSLTVHGAIFAYGLAIVDNALLGPLAVECAYESSYEFMLCVAPLWIEGGTASPVNPLAIM